jgi:hypothetical protein
MSLIQDAAEVPATPARLHIQANTQGVSDADQGTHRQRLGVPAFSARDSGPGDARANRHILLAQALTNAHGAQDRSNPHRIHAGTVEQPA